MTISEKRFDSPIASFGVSRRRGRLHSSVAFPHLESSDAIVPVNSCTPSFLAPLFHFPPRVWIGCQTFLVGNVDQEGTDLVEIAFLCLSAAIDLVQPRAMYRDLGNAIGRVARERGTSRAFPCHIQQ